MKTIGLLGGMSWESTATYYQLINQGIKQALGGLHSAKVSLYSVDFAEIETLQHLGQWDKTAEILSQGAKSVEAAGADCLLICTNTMHKVAAEIESQLNIPLLHIADATGQALKEATVSKVGLLGTRFTMEQEFYKDRIQDKFGIDVITPNTADRQMVHDVIYQELCVGKLQESSRVRYLNVIKSLKKQGAQAVILGCTEIGLLIKPEHTNMPLFDTTVIHAQAAVNFATGANTLA